MSQADYDIANQAGAAFRADLNAHLAAIVSNNSGATEPSTTFAYQWWADTATGLLKIRNAANSGWVTVGTLASANLGLVPPAANTSAAGVVELAIDAEAQAGTDSTRCVTPDNLGAVVLGLGQTWQPQARSPGVTYTNSAGRAILVNYAGTVSTTAFLTATVAGSTCGFSSTATAGNTASITGVLVPNGATYSIALSAGTISSALWMELR